MGYTNCKLSVAERFVEPADNMRGREGLAPANAPWKTIEFALVFAMWAVMMVGMMVPSAAPMILM